MKKLLMPAYLSFIITFLPSNVISQDANTILAIVGETKITLGHVIALQSRLTTQYKNCLLYTSPSPRDRTRSRMPSSA